MVCVALLAELLEGVLEAGGCEDDEEEDGRGLDRVAQDEVAHGEEGRARGEIADDDRGERRHGG